MLNDSDIEQLCHGRLIYANLYNSSGTDAAGPHWAVILDSDESVAEHDSYYVAAISHDATSKFIMPVPRKLRTGYIQGEWTLLVQLPGIIKIGRALSVNEMHDVLALVRAARAARRSTQS